MISVIISVNQKRVGSASAREETMSMSSLNMRRIRKRRISEGRTTIEGRSRKAWTLDTNSQLVGVQSVHSHS